MEKKLGTNTEDQLRREIQELKSRLTEAEKKLSERHYLHRQTEENLKQNESLLRLVADQLPAFVAYVSAPDLVYRFVNRKYEISFQRPRNKIIGQKVSKILGRDNFEYALPYIECALNGRSCSYENKFLLAEGARWIHVSFVPDTDQTGKVIGIVILNFDVTDRRQTEKALKESETKYRELVENSPDAISIYAEGKIVFINKECLRLMAASGPDELIGKPVIEFVHPDYRAMVMERMKKATLERTVLPLNEEKFIRLDGSEIEVEVKAMPVTLDNKPAVQLIVRDITYRKLAEKALIASETRFRNMIDASPVPMALNDEQQNITFVNPAFVQTFGYTLEDIPTLQQWRSNAYPDPEYRRWLQDTWNKKLEQAKRTGTTFKPIEETIRCKNGNIKIVMISDTSVATYPDNLHLVVFYDVTARKHAEEELLLMNETLEDRVSERTSELKDINKKLEFHINEIEQFTYIASHDLQEPLIALTTFTQLIQQEYAGKLGGDGNKYIEFVYKAAARMRELMTGLLKYSLLGKNAEHTRVDCNEIIGEVIADLDDSIKASDAKILVDHLPEVNGSSPELKLLFLQLVVNAIKFRKPEVPPEIKIMVKNQKEHWSFSVHDNGIGIQQKEKEKIFIIFRRMHNRDEYGGTGIGLALCKKIVELHGGEIRVESEPGSGSTFIFTIPKH